MSNSLRVKQAQRMKKWPAFLCTYTILTVGVDGSICVVISPHSERRRPLTASAPDYSHILRTFDFEQHDATTGIARWRDVKPVPTGLQNHTFLQLQRHIRPVENQRACVPWAVVDVGDDHMVGRGVEQSSLQGLGAVRRIAALHSDGARRVVVPAAVRGVQQQEEEQWPAVRARRHLEETAPARARADAHQKRQGSCTQERTGASSTPKCTACV